MKVPFPVLMRRCSCFCDVTRELASQPQRSLLRSWIHFLICTRRLHSPANGKLCCPLGIVVLCMANGFFTFLQAREGPKLDRSCREPDDKIIRYHRYDLLRFTCIANVFSTPAHARGTVSKLSGLLLWLGMHGRSTRIISQFLVSA